MRYVTIQKVQCVGDLTRFGDHLEELADALHAHEDTDPAVEDPDLAASLHDGMVDVQMVVDAADPAEAAVKAQCVLRSAIHSIGGATPGWETQRAELRVSPADVLADA